MQPSSQRATRKADKNGRRLIRKWENTPSPNPELKGVTPKLAARKLLRVRTGKQS